MRVAQISTTSTFIPKYYSSNEYLICRGLAKLGHEVTLFIADKQPKWQTLRNSEIQKRVEKYDGFTVYRLPAGPEIGVVPLIPSLFPTLMKMNFDIIHAHDFAHASSFYGAIASRIKQIPFILTQHSVKLPSKTTSAFLYLANSFTFGRYVFSHSHRIIALDTAIETNLTSRGVDKSKIEIVANAVDTRFFSTDIENFLERNWGISGPVILFVGRLVKDKGIKYLLQAFSDVFKEISNVKLVIIGKGPEEKKLKALSENLLLDNVFFLGVVENRFMPNVYAGCDIVVLPSVIEPFGNVVIEAMASGKPVIGSYVGGIKDTIIHGVTGFHVPPRNSEALSGFLIKLLNDASLRDRLGHNARKKAVENYYEETTVRKIESIYNQCLNQ